MLKNINEKITWGLLSKNFSFSAELNKEVLHNYANFCIKNNVEYFFDDLSKNIVDKDNGFDDFHTDVNRVLRYKKLKCLAIQTKASLLSDSFLKQIKNHVFLKGISYLDTIDINKRYFRDIDVLIGEEDIAKAVEIANQHGFEFKNQIAFSQSMITDSNSSYNLPPMVDSNGIILELHYRIMDQYDSKVCPLATDMLKNTKIININNMQFKVAINELSFIHLIYHATQKGSYDVGPSALRDFFLFKTLKTINNDNLKILQANYNLDREIRFYELLFVDDDVINYQEKLKKYYFIKLFLLPVFNKKIIGFATEQGLFSKLLYVLRLIFVNPKVIKRENGKFTMVLLPYLYLKRWARQFAEFAPKIVNAIHKRNFIVEREAIFKKLGL